jgi:hypothetical protein
MNFKPLSFTFPLLLVLLSACSTPKAQTASTAQENVQDPLLYPEEMHFKNITQLTFGGDNAEAYWSFDSKYLVFQHYNQQLIDNMFEHK